ncbi:MAG TPA: BON domain-containing protein [Thermoguttaceae bacterium]|nr:BON domain-containing protein [Thermoguttaceae bacterium]HPP51682.1 BON domain-containing protein [Thermoguttaceae bacterium]
MDQRPGRLILEGGTSETLSPPLPETSADLERLAASIQRAVQQETHGGIRNLQVTVTAKEILLFGCCTTYYLKQLAQHAAMSFAGRNEVINLIEVR